MLEPHIGFSGLTELIREKRNPSRFSFAAKILKIRASGQTLFSSSFDGSHFGRFLAESGEALTVHPPLARAPLRIFHRRLVSRAEDRCEDEDGSEDRFHVRTLADRAPRCVSPPFEIRQKMSREPDDLSLGGRIEFWKFRPLAQCSAKKLDAD